MDYLTMYLEDLIDTSSVYDIVTIYLRVIHTLPSQTKDLVRSNDEPIEIPPLPATNLSTILRSSYLLPLVVTSKKRKVG